MNAPSKISQAIRAHHEQTIRNSPLDLPINRELALRNLSEPSARLSITEERIKAHTEDGLKWIEKRIKASPGDFVILSKAEAEILGSQFKECVTLLERKEQASGYKRLIYDLTASLESRAAEDNHFISARNQTGRDFRDAGKFIWNCIVDFDNFIMAAVKLANSHCRGFGFPTNIFDRLFQRTWDEEGCGVEFEEAAEAADAELQAAE